MKTLPTLAALAAGLALSIPHTPDAGAQGIRLPATGTTDLVFASRPSVCSVGGGSIGERRANGRLNLFFVSLDHVSKRELRDEDCVHAPAHVVIRTRGGQVEEVKATVEAAPRATRISALAAARTLLDVSRTASGRAGEQAILAAALADSASVWSELLRIAENPAVPAASRRSALYWGGRLGGAAAVPTLVRIARAERWEQETREHAMMTLALELTPQGIPLLTQITRDGGDDWLRAKATFWIGQSDDPAGARLMRDYARRTDISQQVRSEAIFALGNEHAAPGAAALVREIFPTLHGGDLREKALIAVQRIGGADNVRWLERIAADASQPEEVRILAWHLSREPGER
jgi:hypothetical protein